MGISSCKICGSPLTPFLKDIFDDRHGYPGKFDIHRCNSCGFGQTIPEIPEDRIPEIYTEYYPRKNLAVQQISARLVTLISPAQRWWMGVNNTAHYHIRNDSRVLDIGCGDCTSVREINAMGAEGYGIEPDRNIKAIVDTLGLNVHIGMFDDIPYPVNFFDYITMSQVLEHIHDPVNLLISFRRILKDNGQIIIGVPNIDSRLRKKYAHRWLNWHIPYHVNHFSRKSIAVLAEKSGYHLRRIKTYTPNLWVDLQDKLFKFPVREGVKVPFFNNQADLLAEDSKNAPACSVIKRLANKFNNKALSLLSKFNAFQILRLRTYDALGMGESYLVFLEKK
jgi:SAM-dependent methyltransferase